MLFSVETHSSGWPPSCRPPKGSSSWSRPWISSRDARPDASRSTPYTYSMSVTRPQVAMRRSEGGPPSPLLKTPGGGHRAALRERVLFVPDEERQVREAFQRVGAQVEDGSAGQAVVAGRSGRMGLDA